MVKAEIIDDKLHAFYSIWYKSLFDHCMCLEYSQSDQARRSQQVLSCWQDTFGFKTDIEKTVPSSFWKLTHEQRINKILELEINMAQKKRRTHIATPEDLFAYVSKNFRETDSDKQASDTKTSEQTITNESKHLREWFTCFDEIYSHPTNKPLHENAYKILKESLNEKALNKMATFFGIKENPNDIPFQHILTFFPQTPKCTYGGVAGHCFAHQFFAFKPNDNLEYIPNSIVPIDYQQTPIHEITHILFKKSQIQQDIKDEKSSEIKNFTDNFADWLEKNPALKKFHNQPKKEAAIRALDEAFAACSEVLSHRENNPNFSTQNRTWYKGFEGANQLAPVIYPLLEAYTNTGKTIDATFFKKLNESAEETLFNPPKNAEISVNPNETQVDKQKRQSYLRPPFVKDM